ncbi:MAG: hypothetical protein M3348_01680 [Acidobacteriota bacterium]|nr:hypothetical protein [Acidobacteriota bacterium]
MKETEIGGAQNAAGGNIPRDGHRTVEELARAEPPGEYARRQAENLDALRREFERRADVTRYRDLREDVRRLKGRIADKEREMREIESRQPRHLLRTE